MGALRETTLIAALEAGEVVLDGEVEVVWGEALRFAVDFAEVFHLPQ